MARRPGRPREDHAALTRQGILNTALMLIDQQGAEALTMRRLAAALGVDPMAIYHHLPNKRAVVLALVERVFREAALPAPQDSWQAELRALAAWYRGLARAHPNLVLHLVLNAEGSASAALVVNERLYAALERAGLAPLDVLRAGDLLIDFLNGWALGEAGGALSQPDERAGLIALVQNQADRFPVQARLFAALPPDSVISSFEAELSLILGGIEAQARGSG